jgi:hypothetical protein
MRLGYGAVRYRDVADVPAARPQLDEHQVTAPSQVLGEPQMPSAQEAAACSRA